MFVCPYVPPVYTAMSPGLGTKLRVFAYILKPAGY